MKRTVLFVVLVCGVLLFEGAGLGADATASLFPVAGLNELLAYPVAIPSSERPADLYVTALPEGGVVVVLRPIGESEYASFQIQAIGYQMIEQQMLAAAIVLPFVTPADAAGFSKALSDFLKARVNEISGFGVFDVGVP